MLGIFIDAVKPNIQRNRRLKAAVIDTARRRSIVSMLRTAFDNGQRTEEEVEALAVGCWVHWKTEDRLMPELAKGCFDPQTDVDEATSRLLGDRSKELESLDKAIANAERRRNGFLNEIGKRRESQARMKERLRKASQAFAAEQEAHEDRAIKHKWQPKDANGVRTPDFG